MKYICFILAILCSFLGSAQSTPSVTISGTVSSIDQSPMAGTVLSLQYHHQQVLTDLKGRFTLQLSHFPDTLFITHTGYRNKTILITSGMALPLIIELEPLVNELSEVVVSTGYQEIPKERATGSFVKIDKELFNRRVSTNVLDRLENIAPGLLFNRNTISSSKGTLDLSVRGHSTLFANDQPLIVLDNFPYDGELSNLNPNDIESVTLLKDAAAASIWGVKAGNGVIVITSKKGKMNQPLSVSINTNTSFGKRPDLYYDRNFLNASDFIDLEDSLFRRGYYNADFIAADHPPLSQAVEIFRKKQLGLISADQADQQIAALRGLDIRDQLSRYLYQPSLNRQYAVNINGGTAGSNYVFSAGFDNNLSSAVGNRNSRTALNGRYNLSLTKQLLLSVGGSFTQSFARNNNPGTLSTGGPNSRRLTPYTQIADANGNPLSIIKDFSATYTDTAGAGKLLDWKYRPLDEISLSDNTTGATDIRINLSLVYAFNPHLNAEIRYQYENTQSDNRVVAGEQSYFTRNLINTYLSIVNGIVSSPIPAGGILDTRSSTLNSSRARLQLNYTNTFHSIHNLSAIAGMEASDVVVGTASNRFYGYNDDLYTNNTLVDYTGLYKWYYNPGRSGRVPNPQSLSELTDRYLSYYANAAYSLYSRYTFSLSGRIDRSNLFGVSTNLKAVPLFSAGLSWDLTRESFYHLTWLPQLKLRTTLGYSGNTNKTVTGYTTAINNTVGLYSGYPAATITNPGNPELRWEKVRMFNIGIDFGLKSDILSGSLEYYQKKGIDLIGSAPIAPSSGFTTFQGNTAGTTGSGFDIVVNSLNHNRKWKWTTQWILSQATDRVSSYDVKATPATYILNGSGNAGQIFPLLGKPLFAIYSYPWAGLDPSTGNPRGLLDGSPSIDYNNILAKTTLDNMILSGNARPTIYGSLRNTFTCKGISLSFTIAYKLNYVFRRSSISYAALFQNWLGNTDYASRWQKPGDELLTDIPSLQFPPVNNNREQFYNYASVLVEKGDNIRLQDIELSYSQAMHSKTGTIKGLKIYTYLNNLGILWRANKKGLDPDLFSGNLPLPTSFSIGCNLNF